MDRVALSAWNTHLTHKGSRINELKQISKNILYCLRNFNIIYFTNLTLMRYPLQKKKNSQMIQINKSSGEFHRIRIVVVRIHCITNNYRNNSYSF